MALIMTGWEEILKKFTSWYSIREPDNLLDFCTLIAIRYPFEKLSEHTFIDADRLAILRAAVLSPRGGER